MKNQNASPKKKQDTGRASEFVDLPLAIPPFQMKWLVSLRHHRDAQVEHFGPLAAKCSVVVRIILLDACQQAFHPIAIQAWSDVHMAAVVLDGELLDGIFGHA